MAVIIVVASPNPSENWGATQLHTSCPLGHTVSRVHRRPSQSTGEHPRTDSPPTIGHRHLRERPGLQLPEHRVGDQLIEAADVDVPAQLDLDVPGAGPQLQLRI